MEKRKSTKSSSAISKDKTKQISNSAKDVMACRRDDMSMVQNVRLIWLDNNINEDNEECGNKITELRCVVNTIDMFTDCDQCIDFLTDICTVKVFMIISSELIQYILPLIHDVTQLDRVYIFGVNKTCQEHWIKEWHKIKGIFTDVQSICEDLKGAVQQCERNAIGISFMPTTSDASITNLDQLDCSFMYTQLLKEILLTLEFTQEHLNEFTNYCRAVFVDNHYKLNSVNKFEQKYCDETPIWWYTCDSFLYPMLNRALRTLDADIIIKMGFFIRDLHQHIEQLHFEQFSGHRLSQILTLFRGQSLSKTDFDQLAKTKGGLMSFNNFLSTSEDRDMSLTFAGKDLLNPDMVGILFVMTINPSESTTPFASINDVSCFPEDEVLFSMHTIFRIHEIKQLDENNRLLQVDLILTSDNDQQLRTLTERMRQEIFPDAEGWERLGLLLLRMGHSNKPQQVYEVLLEQTTYDYEKGSIYNQLGWAKYNQGEYEEALSFYEKALEIGRKILPPNHLALAVSYNNIGLACKNMGEYSKALSSFEKALEIDQKNLPLNHPDLAVSYSNIGLVHYNMDEYSKALSFYKKALEIRQKTLPLNHPDLASSYNNIGNVYDSMGEYSKALSSHKKALEIGQKSLHSNHPNLAASYYNIGGMYKNMDQYSKAFSFYELAVDIGQRSLPSNHPHLQEYRKNLNLVKKKL